MICPYCNREMSAGYLRSVESAPIFWFPEGKEYHGWVLTKSKIEKQGGIVLDETSTIGFVLKSRSTSFWCKDCKTFITKL